MLCLLTKLNLPIETFSKIALIKHRFKPVFNHGWFRKSCYKCVWGQFSRCCIWILFPFVPKIISQNSISWSYCDTIRSSMSSKDLIIMGNLNLLSIDSNSKFNQLLTERTTISIYYNSKIIKLQGADTVSTFSLNQTPGLRWTDKPTLDGTIDPFPELSQSLIRGKVSTIESPLMDHLLSGSVDLLFLILAETHFVMISLSQ